jgi:hypothetical protein
LSQSFDLKRLSNWDAVVCPPSVKVAASSPIAFESNAAADLVKMLRQGLEHGGSLPVPLSSGGRYLLGFLDSPERWIAPGKPGTESLRDLGPWPIVRNESEASALRGRVSEFITHLAQDLIKENARRQLETKADLLRALLLVLCPGKESLETVELPTTKLVPPLYFIGRIEQRDWEDLVGSYEQTDFQALASHSLKDCELASMAQPVLDWLLMQVEGNREGLLAQYALRALRLYAPKALSANRGSDPAQW